MNNANRHEIELDMMLLNNRAVLTAVLIVDINVVVVVFDAVEIKWRIRSRTSNQKKKLKNIIITTINNPKEEKTGKKLTRSANDKREWVICTDLELAQSFDTMLTENEFWIIKWKWKWSNKYRANKMWSIDQWDETTINEKKN